MVTYNAFRRFGFIKAGGHSDIFFSAKDVSSDSSPPTEGSVVSFLAGQDFRSGRSQAYAIRVEGR